MRNGQFVIATLIGAAGMLAMGGCASEFGPGVSTSRATRAVQAPVDDASASGEMVKDAAPGTPIVAVDGPNSKTDHATVHTIVDPLLKPTGPTVTIKPGAGEPTGGAPTPVIKQPGHPDVIEGSGD